MARPEQAFWVVAHRGVHDDFPENSLPAFERAMALGADSIELDVRLSSDGVPVVFHNFYLDRVSTLSGPVHAHTAAELTRASLLFQDRSLADRCGIPTLAHVLAMLGGRIGLEIELKGPEPEAAEIVAAMLNGTVPPHWPAVEVTSFEPWLLAQFNRLCPTVPVDFLAPLTASWMELNGAIYQAVQRGRMAGARAIHLHATQLTVESVGFVRARGLEVHAWAVNDDRARQLAFDLAISQVCTDRVAQTLAFRKQLPQELPVVQHLDTSR